jgi:hypothetical protein
MKKENRRPTRVALSLVLALVVIVPATSASAYIRGGWRHLGNDALDKLNGSVYALNTEVDGVLYAGGSFYDAGGRPNADYIASWDGQDWSALGAPPLNGAVHAIAVDGDRVFVGGVFTNAGGDANADFLAVWDGTSWGRGCNAASGPAIGGNVEALEIIGNTLYVGGSFQNGGGLAAADYLLACQLDSGAAAPTVLDDQAISGSILTMDSDSAGNLYVGGGFFNMANNPQADNVAYLDTGGVWHEMGAVGVNNNDGSTDFVRALTVAENDDVYVSTDGLNIAGIAQADHVARWNGSEWSAMGSNTAGDNGWFPATTYTYAMATLGSLVFVTGSFQNANGEPRADNVAYFDGIEWHNLGENGQDNGPWIGEGASLDVSEGKVFAGGSFTSAAGDPLARGLATFLVSQPEAIIDQKGEQVFSKDGSGQTITRSVARGHQTSFGLSLSNAGLLEEVFRLRGTGGARGFRVSYHTPPTLSHPSQDVTDSVRGGIDLLYAPYDGDNLRMTVKVLNRSARSASFLTKLSSKAVNGGVDAVKVVVKAK